MNTHIWLIPTVQTIRLLCKRLLGSTDGSVRHLCWNCHGILGLPVHRRIPSIQMWMKWWTKRVLTWCWVWGFESYQVGFHLCCCDTVYSIMLWCCWLTHHVSSTSTQMGLALLVSDQFCILSDITALILVMYWKISKTGIGVFPE